MTGLKKTWIFSHDVTRVNVTDVAQNASLKDITEITPSPADLCSCPAFR